jgi:hypothetical protein
MRSAGQHTERAPGQGAYWPLEGPGTGPGGPVLRPLDQAQVLVGRLVLPKKRTGRLFFFGFVLF